MQDSLNRLGAELDYYRNREVGRLISVGFTPGAAVDHVWRTRDLIVNKCDLPPWSDSRFNNG